MKRRLETLRSEGEISALDHRFAESLGRRAPDASERVLLAAALASRRVREGHVCLDLAALATDTEAKRFAFLCEGDWRRELRSSTIVDAGATGSAPLLLDDADRLYLRRYWDYESRLATTLRERLARPALPVPDALDARIAALFGNDPTPSGLSQRSAAARALRSALCVITGGPGSGKTWTVLRILALEVEVALDAGRRAPRVALVAPTGKAASRLADSIRSGRGDLAVREEVRAHLDVEATTIHRALGMRGGARPSFRHGRDAPLPVDLAIVDEASMVDLSLMSRFVDALPEACKLILLGDANQLASVEAGAVLGDLCAPPPASASSTGFAECVAVLEGSRRFDPSTAIGVLAEAVRRGDVEAALSAFDLDDSVRLRPPTAPATAIQRELGGEFEALLGAETPGDRLEALERFRVLCALRHGSTGLEAWNREFEAQGRSLRGGSPASGDPILITRNDPALRLFNGDLGVVVRDSRGVAAYFPSAIATASVNSTVPPRRIPLSRLPPHESAFAMSIHKSQGSEVDRAAIVLPEVDSAILTRELLYTGITRARRSVVVYANEETLRRCIGRSVQRSSGLRDALWAE